MRAKYVGNFKQELTFGMAGGLPCGYFAKMMITVFSGLTAPFLSAIIGCTSLTHQYSEANL